ncbi:hypothetical protein Droror1_Dr00012102, partial [Drosera rotundifolia]
KNTGSIKCRSPQQKKKSNPQPEQELPVGFELPHSNPKTNSIHPSPIATQHYSATRLIRLITTITCLTPTCSSRPWPRHHSHPPQLTFINHHSPPHYPIKPHQSPCITTITNHPTNQAPALIPLCHNPFPDYPPLSTTRKPVHHCPYTQCTERGEHDEKARQREAEGAQRWRCGGGRTGRGGVEKMRRVRLLERRKVERQLGILRRDEVEKKAEKEGKEFYVEKSNAMTLTLV